MVLCSVKRTCTPKGCARRAIGPFMVILSARNGQCPFSVQSFTGYTHMRGFPLMMLCHMSWRA